MFEYIQFGDIRMIETKRGLTLLALVFALSGIVSAQVNFRDDDGFNFYDNLNMESSANISMNGNRILGLPSPQSSGEPVTKGDIGTDVVDRAGDTMTGDLDLQGNTLLGDAGEIQFDNPIMNVIGDMEVSGDIDADTINGTPVEEIGSQNLSEVVSEGNTAGSNIIMNAAIASITQISGQSGPILVSSNLDLQDQYSLEGIAGIVECSSSQVLAGDGSCKDLSQGSSTLNETLIQGNSAGNNDINVNGNNVEEVNQITGSSGNQVKIASPGLDLQSNDINDVSCIGDNCP